MPLSDEEFAAHVNKPESEGGTGGGSVGYFTREPVTGRGFMTAAVPIAEHTKKRGALTGKNISTYRAKWAKEAAKVPARTGLAPVHGAWGKTQDISVQAPTPNAAKAMGTSEGEMESYALPHTPVNRKGATVGPGGGAVLLHMGQFGKESANENYRPGALDMKDGKGGLTKYEYQNKDWNVVGGMMRDPETGEQKPHTLGDVLKTINTNRALRQRKAIGRE